MGLTDLARGHEKNMTRALGVIMISLGVSYGVSAQDAAPLRAGRDAPSPVKLHAPVPPYPPAARSNRLQGLIVLHVTLNPEGRPADIRLLRAIPILDQAAVEAVRTWRYEPTVVGGVARRVAVVEFVEFFLGEDQMVQAYRDIATNRREAAAVRLHAISRLTQLPPKRHKAVRKTLEKLGSDPSAEIADAARNGLASLASEPK